MASKSTRVPPWSIIFMLPRPLLRIGPTSNCRTGTVYSRLAPPMPSLKSPVAVGRRPRRSAPKRVMMLSVAPVSSMMAAAVPLMVPALASTRCWP